MNEQHSIASYNETIQYDLEKAKKEGRQEGREEGELKARYIAAEKALRKGLSLEIVSEINDLPIEVVREMKRKIDNETSE